MLFSLVVPWFLHFSLRSHDLNKLITMLVKQFCFQLLLPDGEPLESDHLILESPDDQANAGKLILSVLFQQ